MAKKSRKDLLSENAKRVGLYVATWSPGDGVARFRFFKSRKPVSYYQGDGVYTALGIKEAETWLSGYRRRR